MIDLGKYDLKEKEPDLPTYLFSDHIEKPADGSHDGTVRLFVIRTQTPRIIVEIFRDEEGNMHGKPMQQLEPMSENAAAILMQEIAEFAAQEINERSDDDGDTVEPR